LFKSRLWPMFERYVNFEFYKTATAEGISNQGLRDM